MVIEGSSPWHAAVSVVVDSHTKKTLDVML